MKVVKIGQAHQLYKACFTNSALIKVYEEKISISRAIGKDGIRQNLFKKRLNDEVDLIVRKVDRCIYSFTEFKPKLISRGPRRIPRVLSIPTIRDRLTLRILNNILCLVFKDAKILRPHVYIKKIKEFLVENHNGLAFVRIDIQDFFPSVNHKYLVKKLKTRIRKKQLVLLVESAISTPTYGIDSIGKGIPQGLSISNILSSIYLHKIDQKYKQMYTYFRYVDDILVICNEKESGKIFDEIRTDMESLQLTCHELGAEGKSQISSVHKGIEYLGFHITPDRISVRKSSYKRMIENLLAVLTQHKHAGKRRNESRLIWRLNLKITGCIYNNDRYGWVFFFSQIDDLSQLARLDHFVAEQLNRRNLSHLGLRVKKFVRSYHEIRLNLRETKYIPKFDEMSLREMIAELSEAEGNPKVHYELKFTEQEVRKKFAALINRQTRQLEKDLIEATS